MRFAVIGDIHSNIYALEGVLDDIKTRDVDFTLCTGDMVGYAPFPNEVIQLVRKSNILSIQGNYDRMIMRKQQMPLKHVNCFPMNLQICSEKDKMNSMSMNKSLRKVEFAEGFFYCLGKFVVF